jgi:hypothetical protein
MVHLGKYVKGRTVVSTEHKRTMIKIRHQDRTMEDLDKEQQLMKMKRETLKNSMIDE